MAAFLRRTELGLKETGSSCIVPNNNTAKLMYYLDCMSSVLKMEDMDTQFMRLCDYKNYQRLSEDDIDKLILMCFLLSPDVLLNKCIFQDDALCKDGPNKFYELSAVRNHFMVTSSILIGGRQRQVHKIMTFKMSWLRSYWQDPMEFFKSRLQRIASGRKRKKPSSCIII